MVVGMPRLLRMRLISTRRRCNAARLVRCVREICGCDLLHASAGLVEGGATSLLLGNRMGIALAVLDMIANDACRADERLARPGLCERKDERVGFAYDFCVASGVAPVITPIIPPIIARVVSRNWLSRHLEPPEEVIGAGTSLSPGRIAIPRQDAIHRDG